MALDPSIILKVKTPGDIQEQQLGNQVKQTQLQNAQFEQTLQPLKAQAATNALDMDKYKMAKVKTEAALGYLMRSTNPETYAQNRQAAISEGLATPETIPEQYDPAWIKQSAYSLLDTKDRLDLELKKVDDTRADATLAETKRFHDLSLGDRADNRKEKQDQINDRGAQAYSNTIDKNGLTDLASAVNNTVDVISPYLDGKSDIPGFGSVAGKIPGFAISQGGRDLRQAYASVRNTILKARSGGAVTPQEGDRLLQELGEGTGIPDEQVVKGLGNVAKFLQQRLASLQAGYNPGAIDLYKQRGGNTTADSIKQIGGKTKSAIKPGTTVKWDDL